MASDADAGAPLAVATEVVRLTEEAYLEAVPGQVRPAHSAVVSARIQGEIGRLAVAAGQKVERGDLLAELISEDLDARARRAQAELEAASLELERVENLVESRAATPRELEAAEARHRSARASLDEAQTFLAYATVRAPFAGVVARKAVEEGDLVSPGQAILELYSPELFRLEGWVPESLARSIAVGDRLSFEVDPAVASGTGPVSEVRPAVDPGTRTVLVKVDLPASDGLRDGQYGRILAPGDEVIRITVPDTSVVRRGQLEYLFAVSGEPPRARLRLVRAGASRDGRVEILSGVDEGERVVASISSGLRDGQKVEIR